MGLRHIGIMENNIQLYSYFRSSSAYRVRIALNIKDIPHDIIPIHLLKNGGEQYSEDYKKLNPSAQVPTLVHNGNAIGQSLAILEYLEDVFPQNPLLPKTAADRAMVRQMCEIINSGMQPFQNISVTQFLSGAFNSTEDQKKQWMATWLHRGFESLETLYKHHAGMYSFGDQFTNADCCLVPQIFSANRFGVDLTSYPKAKQIYENCIKLKAVLKASPEQQSDYQKA